MKSVYFFLAIFSCLAHQVWAQSETLRTVSTDQLNYKGGNLMPNSGRTLYGFDNRTGEYVGDYYLFGSWAKGEVGFYPKEVVVEGKKARLDTIANIPVRYNVKHYLLEIKTQYGVKVAAEDLVKYFIAVDSLQQEHYFVSTKEFGGKAEKLNGMFEVLTLGGLTLLQHHYVWEKKPTYIPQFDVGSHDTVVYKKFNMFYAKGKEVAKLNTSKDAILKLMADEQEKMKRFMGENADWDTPLGLARVFDYYNSLKGEVKNN